MNTRAVLPILLALATPALGGDREAIEHYQEATRRWNDPDPKAAVAAAEKALAEAQSKKIRVNVLLMLGRLHSAKTGDNAKALYYYDMIIAEVSEHTKRDAPLKGLKADALLSKGNILVADKDDRKGALEHYHKSYDLLPSVANCDVLSQFLFRDSYAVEDPSKKRAMLENALNYAREAVHLASADKRTRPAHLAKVRLQHVIVLTATGAKDEAEKVWKELGGAEALDDWAAYQLAQLHALQGKDAAEVGGLLRNAMKVRPTAATRNQLRKWIRSEPLFEELKADGSWKDLIEDEPEAG